MYLLETLQDESERALKVLVCLFVTCYVHYTYMYIHVHVRPESLLISPKATGVTRIYVRMRRCRVAPSPSSPTTHYMHVSTAPGGNPGVPPPPLSPAAPLAPGRNVKRKPPMLANLIWGGTVLHTQSSFEINFKGGDRKKV